MARASEPVSLEDTCWRATTTTTRSTRASARSAAAQRGHNDVGVVGCTVHRRTYHCTCLLQRLALASRMLIWRCTRSSSRTMSLPQSPRTIAYHQACRAWWMFGSSRHKYGRCWLPTCRYHRRIWPVLVWYERVVAFSAAAACVVALRLLTKLLCMSCSSTSSILPRAFRCASRVSSASVMIKHPRMQRAHSRWWRCMSDKLWHPRAREQQLPSSGSYTHPPPLLMHVRGITPLANNTISSTQTEQCS
jgi:hypothetical protein